jgi:hypothetical protein
MPGYHLTSESLQPHEVVLRGGQCASEIAIRHIREGEPVQSTPGQHFYVHTAEGRVLAVDVGTPDAPNIQPVATQELSQAQALAVARVAQPVTQPSRKAFSVTGQGHTYADSVPSQVTGFDYTQRSPSSGELKTPMNRTPVYQPDEVIVSAPLHPYVAELLGE